MFDASKVSSFLFANDPVGTGCVENDLYDEYDVPANMLLSDHIELPLDADDVRDFFAMYFEYEGLSDEFVSDLIAVLDENAKA